MKKFLAALLVALSAGIASSASVRADDEVPSPKPVEIMRQKHDASITTGMSRVWDMDAPGAVPFVIAYNETAPAVASPTSPYVLDARLLCNGVDDPSCAPGTVNKLKASTVLGLCASEAEIGCIESFSSQIGTAAMAPLTMVSGGDTIHPENPGFKIPRSTTLSTWQDSAGARYVLTAHMETWIASSSGTWSVPTTSSLFVMVSRIPRNTTHPAGNVTIVDNSASPGTHTYGVGNGTPMNTVEMVKGMRFNVKVRVPNTVAGWFQGRIGNAVVGSKALSGSRTVYELEGDVVPVYVAGAEASSTDPKFPVTPWTMPGFISSLSSPSATGEYDRWKPFLGDKAITTRNEWVLSGLSYASNSCFDASKGMTGVASTNSAFYSPTPPTYNPSTGSVEYKVASPHYDETGAVAEGNYSLSIPTAAVQCLYKTDKLPDAAQLSTTYDDGSAPYTVTRSLTNKDGWLNVSVTGLHFSAPTISARFGTISANSSGTANSNFAALMAGAQVSGGSSSSSSSVSSGNYVKTVVAGAKATVTVTLAASGTFSVYRKVGSKLTLVKKASGKKGVNKVVTTYRKGYSFVVKDSKGKTLAVKTSAVRFARFY